MALNTWNAGDGPTYEFCSQSSRIDYICTRRAHADQPARDVKQLRDFDLVPITGAYHIPLLTTIRRDWFPASSHIKTGWTRQQRLQLHAHCSKQDQVFDMFQAQVIAAVQNLVARAHSDLHALHDTLNRFPSTPFQQDQSHKLHRLDMGPFRRFQEHTKKLRRVRSTELVGLFSAWYHVSCRSKARQAMTLTSKASRKARLDQVYNAADRADKAKDHFTLFQAIRSLAPKQVQKRIMLRSDQGELLGPEAAADWLHQWFTDLYSVGDRHFTVEPFDWPFSVGEFTHGLRSLPTHKALAPQFSPAPFWKHGAEAIATYLDKMFHDCCAVPSFPDIWGVGNLALLVKPGKRGQHPSELRPIALLEPTGKTALGLVTKTIQQQLQHLLNRLPQFAYAEGRGTDDAIHRLANHCRLVRQKVSALSYPIHRQQQGLELPALQGGMTLCLDLTRAFDMVDRTRLFAGLVSLGVTDDIIGLLKCVYNTTAYEFEHRGMQRSIKTFRGIRQGCRAAPCLWTVFISVLMLDLANKLTPEFLFLCITIFADDICSHGTFDTEESFETLLHAFGTLLDLIEGANLELNLAKATITLRMTGKSTGKIQRKFMIRTQQGSFLKIPRADGTFTKIKLVRSFKYLGVMLSYHNFERETMQLRLKHSEQTSHQLHRWLYTQRLSAKQRVKIWYQCTFACLRYGLIATGFNDVTLLSFYRFCIKQLRRILREPVHLTKEASWAFLQRHDLQHPLLRLRDLCHKTARRSLQRHQHLQDDDILRITSLPDYDFLIQVIDKVHAQVGAEDTVAEAPSHITPHTCPICQQPFSTLRLMRRHCTVEHGHRSGQLRLLTTHPMSVVPTCQRCGIRFTTWHRYHYHIAFVCMTALQEIDQVEHRLRVQELLQFARAHQVAALCRHAVVLMYFLHHCAICGKFHSTVTGLMRHWNDAHTQTFQRHLPALQYYCTHVDIGNPCELCAVSYIRYHKCIIWRQLAMLLTEMDLTAVYCDIAATAKLVCETCGKAYTTKHGLAQHLQRCHRAEQALTADNWKQLEIQCLIDQAVQTHRADDLLDDLDILQHISAQCLACSQSFRRRQETSRHIKQGHPSEWADVERMATDLTMQINPEQKCYCLPAQHHIKHVCLVFQQFALARLLWEREQQAEAVAMPPNLALTSQERMEQLLWSGFVHLLYRLPALKLALTLHCQFLAVM